MKKIINQVVVSIILLMITQITVAQQTFPVNLETVLQLAGANNLTIQEYKKRYELSLAEQSKAKEWWLPTVYAGVQTHGLTGAAMNGNGFFFTDVKRDNFWAGLGLNAEWNFGDGIYKSLAAKQRAAAVQYESQAQRNKVILEAVNVYYDLFAQQLLYTAYYDLSQQSDTLVKQIKVQVDAGLRYQSELLLAQSNYNHLRILLAASKQEIQNRSAELANLLNIESGVQLLSSDSLLLPVDLLTLETKQVAIDSAIVKRPEFLGLQSGMEALKIERKTTLSGLFIPRLRVGTYASYFGPVISPLYQTNELNASLLWQIPVGRFVYKGDLKMYNTKISIQENRIGQFKNQVQEEIAKSKTQLQNSEEQLKLAEEGLKLSKEALDQSIGRQMLGTVKPFEVFQAQQFYLQAQTDYLKAVSSYNKAQYGLFVASGNNL